MLAASSRSISTLHPSFFVNDDDDYLPVAFGATAAAAAAFAAPPVASMEHHSGTIDPAALNTAASTIAPGLLTQSTSSRGRKRSHSPDSNGVHGVKREADDLPSSKRTKPLKTTDSPGMTTSKSRHAVQTPTIKSQTLPQTSPMQTSPPRSTPGSSNKTVKALPTVRDHTTDQLAPEGDEYIPREIDPDGETKVSKDGDALEGRRFRCRTFTVPNRGAKLFMLATECARVLGYRDSYLLFNKNRSLFKIIANQAEKDDLIRQEVLPYSYRSRQIAIVTARSMFRQFGSRLVENGKRVRDDYWVAKAIKQGFTEADAAGEKRPGGGKAREAAAAEAANAARTTLPQGQIIYSHDELGDGPPVQDQTQLAPLPMIHLSTDEIRPNSYATAIRPRQEINNPPFQDRTQPSSIVEIMTQAPQAADFNKQLSQSRTHRSNYLDDYWRRPHEQPVIESPEIPPGTGAPGQAMQSSPQAMPHMASARSMHDPMSQASGGAQMPSLPYPGYSNQQSTMASPMQSMHRQLPQSQLHQGSPTMGMGVAPGSAAHRQTPSSYNAYGQPTHQMWQQQQHQQQQHQQPQTPQHQQPHASPVPQPHHPSAAAMQYTPQQTQMLPPQMPGQQQQHQQQQSQPPPPPPPNMAAYQQQMSHMTNAAYGGMGRNMYQPSPGTPQQHSQHQQAPHTPQQQHHPSQQQQQGHYGSAPQHQGQGGQQQHGWGGSAGGHQDWGRY